MSKEISPGIWIAAEEYQQLLASHDPASLAKSLDKSGRTNDEYLAHIRVKFGISRVGMSVFALDEGDLALIENAVYGKVSR